ncbi:dedicator of cytokinesis protein 3-like, partial [Lingula anatina]|uniref:Dedicator of cytokinesis protein 3-like n=1 Tax=Lingula anatina TaxID=7574 RepID=A0A1S3JE60_LINAN
MMTADMSDENEREYSTRVQTCTDTPGDKDFPMMHEDMIRKTKTNPGLVNTALTVSLRKFHGTLDEVRHRHPLLVGKSIAITRKIGFSDVIMPGEVRNDFYFSIHRGDFEKGKKTAQKNVEARVVVLDDKGNEMKECLSAGSGELNGDEYKSFIMYHHNKTVWNEIVKICLPIDQFPLCHVRFEFRHCSTQKPKHLFSFGFIRLHDGVTIRDGKHELILYK